MVDEPTLDPTILTFYRDRYVEDDRLVRSAHGRMEFCRTRELLRRFLPPAPARVLDVGGATGIHARWLVADGYDVELLDPVPSHVEQAGSIAGLAVRRGDARALPYADDHADVTLLLGPLYHLVEATDRALALAEAVRVTRPGGLVVAAVISRYAGLLELGASGGVDDATEPALLAALETGVNVDEPAGFTTAYFHRPEEIEAELRAADLADVTVYGVEGPATPALDAAPPERVDDLLPAALRLARLVERDPAVIATSPHLLAVGRVPAVRQRVAGPPVELRSRFVVDDGELSALHHLAFGGDGGVRRWAEYLERHGLTWIGAFAGEELVGFVHLVGDGGTHAFLLDTVVHPRFRRRGIGRDLVRAATAEAFAAGCSWVHADYEPHLTSFYQDACGFRPTAAGLLAAPATGSAVRP